MKPGTIGPDEAQAVFDQVKNSRGLIDREFRKVSRTPEFRRRQARAREEVAEIRAYLGFGTEDEEAA